MRTAGADRSTITNLIAISGQNVSDGHIAVIRANDIGGLFSGRFQVIRIRFILLVQLSTGQWTLIQ